MFARRGRRRPAPTSRLKIRKPVREILCRLDGTPILCFVEDTMAFERQLVSIRNARGSEANGQRGREMVDARGALAREAEVRLRWPAARQVRRYCARSGEAGKKRPAARVCESDKAFIACSRWRRLWPMRSRPRRLSPVGTPDFNYATSIMPWKGTGSR